MAGGNAKMAAGAAAGRPVLLVTGPTASGKSGLALALAEAFDGVVINADSLQVYRELEILTARPHRRDLARAPHRLYGVLPAAERCSAGRWRAMAWHEIGAAEQAGRVPIVVGGTGLYLRALVEGLAAVPPIAPHLRAAAVARHGELGGPAFHAALAARDPDSARRIHPADRQRLIRAWEVLEATGRSLSDWRRAAPGRPEAGPRRFLRLCLQPPRAALYAACDGRFLAMIERGAVAEVARLARLSLDPGLPVMKALGVPQLSAFLAGELSLEAAVAEAQKATRRYAKRQLTWLRTQASGGAESAETGPEARNKPAQFDIFQQFSESLRPETFNIIRDFLLTPEN